MHAEGDAGNREEAQSDEYSVVELPLVVVGGGGGGSSTAAAGSWGEGMALDAQPKPVAAHGAGAAEPASGASAAVQAALAAPAAQPAGGGWVAKKRKQLSEADFQPAAAPTGGGACALPLAAPDEAAPAAGAAGAEQPPAASELEGTAYLALLPNGSITGHLVCPPSAFSRGRRSLGLMGEVVVAGRECTRDADWGVLRLTVIGFGGGARGGGGGGGGAPAAGEVSFLVEKTEGDAMRLRAPVPWTGVEYEELPSLDATCTLPSSAPGLALDFHCQQLLSGPAGESLLAQLQPSLAGRGAAVNVGRMRLALPPEAAAALLPPAAAAVAAAPGGRQPSPPGAAHTPQPAGQQQRVYTGRGSGGGGGGGSRVRVDDDDW